MNSGAMIKSKYQLLKTIVKAKIDRLNFDSSVIADVRFYFFDFLGAKYEVCSNKMEWVVIVAWQDR